MDDNQKNSEFEPTNPETAQKDYLLPASILISTLILAGAWVYTAGLKVSNDPTQSEARKDTTAAANLDENVISREGTVLPVQWGDLGVKMTSVGVIDRQKIASLYAGRGGLAEDERRLLESTDNGNLKITKENSGFLLNLFWALGLGTKNDILERGPMNDPRYGGAGNFASTGGWTMAKGDAVDHYNRHPFVVLTPEQQQLVEQVSKNIYRPCCDNPTHFPDCNHGMAMLGLLELMASQGVNEAEMYKVALQVNTYWFSDAYLTIVQYLTPKGIEWERANPKAILSADYSSASGYRQIVDQLNAPAEQNGGSCGV